MRIEEKMFLVYIILSVILFGMAKTETETEAAILKRLDVYEGVIQELLLKVDTLSSQDQLQKMQIASLENKMQVQHERTIHLENLIRRLSVNHRKRMQIRGKKATVQAEVETDTIRGSGQQINRIRRQEPETQVAFFAKMGKHLEHAGIHQPFIFENAVTNIGNGYNPHLGSFVAPVSGTYVFSTTLVSLFHVSGYAQFVKNGKAITNMYVSGVESGNDTTAQTIVLQLQKGDDITIQNLMSDKSFYGHGHSIFSGFLLYENYSSSPIVGK
ncbi:multimerin-2-like [Ruditapes philippinarum]|uniref:multimerin-2-like n=1 Tax=Ruditapes philippinarum TaxID=129788 RepID=UPI00295BA1E5|nr:multimerin-2-like [Ruditapes philippinarum]